MNALVRTLLVLLLAGLLNSDLMAQRGGRRQGSDGSLSATESSELILMREEEKLARDVYIAMSKKWDVNIFSNIARAESRHMQAVAGLLSKYQIPDPIVDQTPGDFTAPKFQQLYKSLVETGSTSLVDAMRVGLKIEEMDIADLRVAIQSTDNNDVKRVLQHLEQGSINHLRAFAAQLERLGGTYVPTHLSQSEFSQIASSSAGKRGNQGRGQGRGARNQPDGTAGSPGPGQGSPGSAGRGRGNRGGGNR